MALYSAKVHDLPAGDGDIARALLRALAPHCSPASLCDALGA
jgi:hypothetical protein